MSANGSSKASRILVVDSGNVIGPKIQEALERFDDPPLQVIRTDLDRAVETTRAQRPSVVILNLHPGVDEALAVGERLVQQLGDGTLIVTSNDATPELILRSMRIGARDFLAQPVSELDLVDVVRKSFESTARPRSGSRSLGGELVVVFSNKGGVGSTSVATNLSATLARQGKEVALVDLELQLGDVSTFLDLQPRYTIADVAQNIERLDPNYLLGCLTSHSSGIKVLTDPLQPVDAESVTPDHVGEVLKLAKTMFHYVIVDTMHTFDERGLVALDMADTILLVTTQTLPAIRNAQRSLELFESLGYDPSAVRVLVNRHLPDQEITRDDVEKALNRTVFWSLPNDYPTMLLSINQGKPVADVAPGSVLARSFDGLAAKLTGEPRDFEHPEPERSSRGLFGGLFGAR